MGAVGSLSSVLRRGCSAAVLALCLCGIVIPAVAQSVRGGLQGAALMAAVDGGDIARVRALLAEGADPNARGADGRTPLIAAAQAGNMAATRALIAAHADLNFATRAGTALDAAERNGHPDVARLLLASGAHSTGESVNDTVCVRPWGGEGFCGRVTAFRIRAVDLEVTKIIGCSNGCVARAECSAGQRVGVAAGIHAGSRVTVPSWCLTETGVKP